MARTSSSTAAATWEAGFRAAVRAGRSGWAASNNRGKILLKLRRKDQIAQSVQLPLDWAPESQAAALQIIGRLYQLVETGEMSLRGALDSVLGVSDQHAPNAATSWAAVAESFRKSLQHGRNEILDQTWHTNYEPFIAEALRLLTSTRPPADGHELLQLTLMKWKGKPPSRAACCIALRNFTEHAVSRHRQPSCWLISQTSIRELRGKPGQKRTKATLDDVELLELIDAIESRNPAWANVIRLLAQYGLRPTELQHLTPKRDEAGQLRLFCSYRKTCGAQLTEPRWLLPCPLKDRLGRLVEWNLAGAMEAGLLELPVGRDGMKRALNGHYVEMFLVRQPEWRALKDKYEARGEWLRPYAFRDSYSLRCHRFGIEVGAVAMAMGHSLAVHSSSYRWASQATTAEAFAKAING